MPDAQKQIDFLKHVDYCWSKPKPLMFITTWGEKGDALWISPTYCSNILEKYRCRWGLSNNNVKNTQNWMFRINFKRNDIKIFAVTDIIGVQQIREIESEIAEIEEQLCQLHTQLYKAKARKLQIYRTACKDYASPITAADIAKIRDYAHSQGPGAVARFNVDMGTH